MALAMDTFEQILYPNPACQNLGCRRRVAIIMTVALGRITPLFGRINRQSIYDSIPSNAICDVTSGVVHPPSDTNNFKHVSSLHIGSMLLIRNIAPSPFLVQAILGPKCLHPVFLFNFRACFLTNSISSQCCYLPS